MASFLLDTNVVSELSRRVPNSALLARFEAQRSSCSLAAITVEELTFGVERMPPSTRRNALSAWLVGMIESLEHISYDSRCATWLGRERARLEEIGLSPSRPDGQIAAVAVINNLTLVTRNTRDFASFSGLRLENWFDG